MWQKEGRAKAAERGKTLPEIQKAELQHQHCRQTHAQVVEPGADSTLLIVIVTLVIVIVNGEGGNQKRSQVGREYRQREESGWMSPSGGIKHPAVSS